MPRKWLGNQYLIYKCWLYYNRCSGSYHYYLLWVYNRTFNIDKVVLVILQVLLNTNCVRNPPYDAGTGLGISRFRSPALRVPLTTSHIPLRAKILILNRQGFNKGSVLGTIPINMYDIWLKPGLATGPQVKQGGSRFNHLLCNTHTICRHKIGKW